MFPRVGTTKDIELNKESLSTLPSELVSKMKEIVEILDTNYSADRNILESLGGYCQVVQSDCEWKEFLKNSRVDKLAYEFVESINDEYVYILYMMSSDYSVAVLIKLSVVDFEFEEE